MLLFINRHESIKRKKNMVKGVNRLDLMITWPFCIDDDKRMCCRQDWRQSSTCTITPPTWTIFKHYRTKLNCQMVGNRFKPKCKTWLVFHVISSHYLIYWKEWKRIEPTVPTRTKRPVKSGKDDDRSGKVVPNKGEDWVHCRTILFSY